MHHSRVPIFLPPNQIWLAAAVQWRSDSDLKLRLKSLVKRGYQRSEILHVMKRDFSQYTWGCIKTLDRRLRHFNINYIEYDTPVEDVRKAGYSSYSRLVRHRPSCIGRKATMQQRQKKERRVCHTWS